MFPVFYGLETADGRAGVRKEIIQRLFLSQQQHQPTSFIQPLVLLCNYEDDNYSTGKTVIASSIAQYSLDEEDYDHILWIHEPEFFRNNIEIFYQHLIKKLKKIHSLTYQFPDIHQIRAQSSHYYENTVLDLLTITKDLKYLLVIDNLIDFSSLGAIKALGIPTLITSRIRPKNFDGYVIEVSRFNENGIDVLSPMPPRYALPEGSLVAAYLLGANQREPSSQHSPEKNILNPEPLLEPTIPLMLHTHLYSCLSPLASKLYSTLRFLPTNIFIPSQLIFYIWKYWLEEEDDNNGDDDGDDNSRRGDANQSNSGAIHFEQEHEVLEELINYSLLQSSPTGDSMLLTTDSKIVLEVFCRPHHLSHKNKIYSALPTASEISHRLAIPFSSISLYLQMELDVHHDCVVPCFEYLGWNTTDLIQLYNPLLGSLLDKADFVVAERFLKSLFEAFDDIPLSSQLTEIGSLNSRDKIFTWIMEWTRRFIESVSLLAIGTRSKTKFESSQTICSMTMFHALICELCHCGDESIAMRKRVIEYQRTFSGDVKRTLGVSLLSLGKSIYIAHSLGTGQVYSREEQAVDSVLESVARMAVKSLVTADPISSLGDCALVFLVDVIELVGADQIEAIGILETVLKLRNKFHETLLHPRIASVYCRLSQIQFRERRYNESLQSINKSIRIHRTLFGEGHYLTCHGKDVLADFQATLSRLETSSSSSLPDLTNLGKLSPNNNSLPILTVAAASPLNSNQRSKKSSLKSEFRKSLDSPSPNKKKISELGNLDDVALLIALAERITKKRDYSKSRKYLVKALQLIRDLMTQQVELVDPTLPLIFKWSAYHKLGELNELEGEPLRAIKFYQRSFKGFLELSLLDSEKSLQHLGEALIVIFHLSTLVESIKGFNEAFPFYFELLMILSDLYTSHVRLTQSPDLHVHILEHLHGVLRRHQLEIPGLVYQMSPDALYQSPNNLFQLQTLKLHLSQSSQVLMNQFMKLTEEICQFIPPPSFLMTPFEDFEVEGEMNKKDDSRKDKAIEERVNGSNKESDEEDSFDDIPERKEKEKEEVPVFSPTQSPQLPVRKFIPLPPKPPTRMEKQIEIQTPNSVFPVTALPLDVKTPPTPPSPTVQITLPQGQRQQEQQHQNEQEQDQELEQEQEQERRYPHSNYRHHRRNRREPRAIHIVGDEISEATPPILPPSAVEEFSAEVAAFETKETLLQTSSNVSQTLQDCESHLVVPSTSITCASPTPSPTHTHAPVPVPAPVSAPVSVTTSSSHEIEVLVSQPLDESLVQLTLAENGNKPQDPVENSPSIVPLAQQEQEQPEQEEQEQLPISHSQDDFPRQPRLSRQVSIKEIQEESTKFIDFFVFGSLRRHQENHSLLSMPNRDESFSYLGTTTTVHKLYLYVNCLTGLPIVTEEPISGCKSTLTTIVGEVYSVTPSIVERAAVLFPDSTLVNIDLNSFGGNLQGNVAVMYLAIDPSLSDWINVPRGNYSQFLSARGGLEAFIAESSKKNKRTSINIADLEKLTENFNERKNPKERRKFKIWD